MMTPSRRRIALFHAAQWNIQTARRCASRDIAQSRRCMANAWRLFKQLQAVGA
jgi:hypothetical protein